MMTIYMNDIKIILIILAIIFFIIFFFVLFTNNNKLIKFRVIKDPIIEETYEETKRIIKTCKDICNNDFCDEYHSQVIKYDLCKECKKENKCYDSLDGICVPCKNNYTCEQLFGCNTKPPINPIDNYCTRCWNYI